MQHFDLFLFSVDPIFAQQAALAGVDAILIDWESKGKEQRQAGENTEINQHTPEDLRRMRQALSIPITCRLNGYSNTTSAEVERAIALGANELLLPMVRSVWEVDQLLNLAQNRVKIGILIETLDATQIAPDLATLPLSRVFIGLNDLAIERRSKQLFTPLADGTIEQLRSYFTIPFGFGGLTLPEYGDPIPCELLVKEMLRLDCQFTFLRRSFYRDIQGRNLSIEIPRMKAWIQSLRNRSEVEIEADFQTLVSRIEPCLGLVKE